MPDGKFARFRIEESPIMEKGLAEKFPEIKTYRGYGIDDPTATVRFDLTSTGFHSMILSAGETVLVDPYAKDDTENYISYLKKDAHRTGEFICDFKEGKPNIFKADTSFLRPFGEFEDVTSGTTLRTYRLALAADFEYCAVFGGTVAGAMTAMTTTMNRVNGVYERDLAIHMNMVANNNLIVYAAGSTNCGGACNSGNDPYTNTNGTTMLGQNTTALNSVIGSGNYDIGHVFSTRGGGGVATLNEPCGGNKARGVTGSPSPSGDGYDIDYVAHEMGHQFGANHTFNGTVDNCGSGNRATTAAYEPGSGITIMAYAGICGNQDLTQATAANVSIGGRVITQNGYGIPHARVFLTNTSGEVISALTNAFGYFLFDNVAAGFYIITAQSKRYQFESSTLEANDNVQDFTIVALPSGLK